MNALTLAALGTGFTFLMTAAGAAVVFLFIVLAVIIVVSLLGSIIPIIRNARRNPINDMRDDM